MSVRGGRRKGEGKTYFDVISWVSSNGALKDNAETRSATAQSPEEILILASVRNAIYAIRCDDLKLSNIAGLVPNERRIIRSNKVPVTRSLLLPH